MKDGVRTGATFDVRAFRAEQSARPLRPYDVILPDDEWVGFRQRLADEILERGWSWQGRPSIPMTPPIAWEDFDSRERSWGFWLHCWQPLASLLSAHSHTGAERYLWHALAVALDWIRHHPSRDCVSTFAWYDMAVGVRAYRLAYLLDAVIRLKESSDEDIGTLVESVATHASALADDDEFAAHSNHGMYQAAGQYALALRFPDLPSMADATRQATERLRQLVSAQFTAEGVHREHSPQYHLLVLGTLESVASLGLGEDPFIGDMLARAEDALAWFIQPNSRLAMFGDSGYRFRAVRSLKEAHNEHLRFALSGGADGSPPPETIKAFPDSGYIVVRDRWPSGPEDFADCSYLAQMCAFHSRTHKHADDLSFVWYEHGAELVSEAGRYAYVGKTKPGSPLWEDGFWYADPNRIYVESTRAHNTVEIDGRPHKRKGVRPYGSALSRWGESNGVHYIETSCVHAPCVQHVRILLYRPNGWLIVFDWLRDTKKVQHEFAQRFHFDPALEPVDVEEGLRMRVGGGPRYLHMLPLLEKEALPLIKGQSEPELLGWVSREEREMLPTYTGGYRSVDTTGLFATLLSLGEDPVHSDYELSRSNQSGRRARLCWRAGASRHRVTFSREGDSFDLEYRVTAQ